MRFVILQVTIMNYGIQVGEKAFLHNYLYQSSLFKDTSIWYTSLVSKKETIKSLEKSGEKLKVKTMKIIPMHQGNKITRIVAWQF